MLPWTWGCRYFFKIVIVILFPSYVYPEVESMDHIVILFLIFWGNSIRFSIAAIQIYIPTNGTQGFPFLHVFAKTISCLSDDSYLIRCEMISHCSFDLHFLDDWWCWIPLHTCWPFVCLFWKMSIQFLCPF